MTGQLMHIPEDNALELLPPAQLPAQAAMAMLRAHAEMMSMAYDLAEKMVRTKLVPTRLQGKAADATAAILYGMELGLTPIQSLQRVIPIHGQPTLEALTMTALLEAKGYTIKVIEDTEDAAEVHGWKPRKNPDVDAPDARCRRTIEWATRAGYVPRPSSEQSLQRPEVESDWVTVTKTFDGRSKTSIVGNMKYITDPQAMLVAKCRTIVSKEIAPHVLLGISGSTEEMRSEPRYDDEPSSSSSAADAITVEEVLGDVGLSPNAQSFHAKVKSAAPAPAEEPEREKQQISEPTGGTMTVSGPAGEKELPHDATAEEIKTAVEETNPAVEGAVEAQVPAPGAPTEETPGQTDRVEKALGNARNKSNARIALLDLLAPCFRDAGYKMPENLATVASSILKIRVKDADALTDSQLKTVYNSLNAWRQVDTLADMVTGIIEAADMNAEAAGDQTTLDN